MDVEAKLKTSIQLDPNYYFLEQHPYKTWNFEFSGSNYDGVWWCGGGQSGCWICDLVLVV